MERLFHLRERRTTVATEIVGGLTTFVTMAYIVVVNPAVLAAAGRGRRGEGGGRRPRRRAGSAGTTHEVGEAAPTRLE